MQYRPFFSLSIRHHHYQQQSCSDFDLEPNQACQHLLTGHRLLLKPRINGLQILCSVDSDLQPMVPLDEPLIFTFLLSLKNPAFAGITQFESQYQPGRSLYIFSNEAQNSPDDLVLSPTIVQLERLARIARGEDLSEPATSLEVRCAAIAEFQTIQRGQFFGCVEIHRRDSLTPDLSQNIEFTIPFPAKQRVWNYYLVTNKTTPAQAFTIQDHSAEKQGQKLKFSMAQHEIEDRVLTSIQQRFPESQTILLRSDTPVDCRDIGRPNLQLHKAGQTKPWVTHLPNPPNTHGTQVINLLEDL